MALFIFGVSAFVGIIPLSGLNTTVAMSNLTVSCAPYAGAINTNACTGSVSMTNSNSSALQGTLWMTVTNQKFQQVQVANAPVSLPPSASSATVPLGAIPIGANYTLTAFVISKQGWVVSPNIQIVFNVGTIAITIDDPGSQIGTTSPSPGTYTYQLGQSVTLTFNPIVGCVFNSWLDAIGGFTSTQNPLTFKPWRNFEFVVQLSSTGCTTPAYTITPQVLGGGGAINPSKQQSLGGVSSQTSVMFTAIPSTNWYFSHWNLITANTNGPLSGQNFTSLLTSSTANPVTITLSSLSSIPVGSALSLQAIIVIGYPLVIGGNAGITVTPPVGSKYYPPGTMVTVTATALAGYCFNGWIVDGVINSANPLTLTMNAAHSVLPIVAPVVRGTNSCAPPPPPPGAIGGLGQIVGGISMLGGGGLMLLGLRRKRG